MRILILVVLTLWPLPCLADYEAGVDAYRQGDFASALREIRPVAEAGMPQAQFMLAAMYGTGRGLPLDNVHAYAWTALSIARGFAPATRLEQALFYQMTPEEVSAAKQLSRELPKGGESLLTSPVVCRDNWRSRLMLDGTSGDRARISARALVGVWSIPKPVAVRAMGRRAGAGGSGREVQ